MENTYGLSILSKSIGFKNLTAASLHVGLSQPQLSRVIAGLEKELNMQLLDRRVKRKARWTNEAYKLVELFEVSQRKFSEAIRDLQETSTPRSVRFGSLEGLVPLAAQMTSGLFQVESIEQVTLDVFDRTELESLFVSGDLDAIFNTRLPSHSTPRLIHTCGYQSLRKQKKGQVDFQILSQFENQIRSKKSKDEQKERRIVSNSLFVRRVWFDNFGGEAIFPSDVHENFEFEDDEVLLIGAPDFDQSLWNLIVQSKT